MEIRNYKQAMVQTQVESADPHRLIQMLMEGVLEKVSTAKGYMQRGEIAEKGRQISSAISIISVLQASLNHEEGGDLAERLEQLYDYMNRILLEANVKNDIKKLDEVYQLMLTIKDGWDKIRDQVIEQ